MREREWDNSRHVYCQKLDNESAHGRNDKYTRLLGPISISSDFIWNCSNAPASPLIGRRQFWPLVNSLDSVSFKLSGLRCIKVSRVKCELNVSTLVLSGLDFKDDWTRPFKDSLVCFKLGCWHLVKRSRLNKG